MRNKILTVFVLSIIFHFVAFAQENFTFGELQQPVSDPDRSRTRFRLTVSTAGTIPADLKTNDFEIVATTKTAQVILPRACLEKVEKAAGSIIELVINLAADRRPELEGYDAKTLTWTVTYTGIPSRPTAHWKASTAPKHLVAAKAKDDASLYFFGSALFGVSTKPLYAIDAKADVRWEVGVPSWFIGFKGTFAANQDVNTPVDRSRVDPDSITAFTSIKRNFSSYGKSGINAAFSQILLEIDPLGGEFSRKYPASDIITAANVRWRSLVSRVGADKSRTWFALYPSLGYEIGKNLNQPSVLFKQPVGLSDWDAIVRFTPAVVADLYAFKKEPTESDLTRFTLEVKYQPRVPFTPEPFVTTSRVGSEILKTATMRKNTRHQVEASANWSFSPLFGVAVKYRYGALPPLFQFVDHQATIGLTFKGKLQ